MHSAPPELSLTNALILLLGLGVTFWMSRAPKSFLKLLSTRLPGLDKDRPTLAVIVRWWGRFSFFSLLYGILLIAAPAVWDKAPGLSLIPFGSALAVSFFVLRRPETAPSPADALKASKMPAGSTR